MFFIKHPFLVLTVFVTLTAPALSQAAEFTAEQKTEIGKIAEDYFTAHPEKMGEAISIYLANHPEFLVAASENLRQSQQAAAQKMKEMQDAAKKAQDHYSGNNPTKLRFLRGSDISSSSLSTHAR